MWNEENYKKMLNQEVKNGKVTFYGTTEFFQNNPWLFKNEEEYRTECLKMNRKPREDLIKKYFWAKSIK